MTHGHKERLTKILLIQEDIQSIVFFVGNQCKIILKKVKQMKLLSELKAFEDFLSNKLIP